MSNENVIDRPIDETAKAFKTLRDFVGSQQIKCMVDLCRKGEERGHFKDKVRDMAELIRTMPKTYEQDGKGQDAVVSLHYFKGGMDWYITEKDIEMPNEPGQHQAFGLANLGQGGELGYISIVELTGSGVELDLYWTPKTLKEIAA